MQRHEAINARVKEGSVDLVFIGDSITQGWERRGKDVWTKFYGQRNAANLGIGGDRTQHVIWRLNNGNLAGIAPKVAVIMIGTNNSGSNTPAEIADGVTTSYTDSSMTACTSASSTPIHTWEIESPSAYWRPQRR